MKGSQAGAATEASPTGAGRRLALVDFETGHYGDPAFDLGFFLSHLILKSVRSAQQVDPWIRLIRTFWNRYVQSLEVESLPAELNVAALEHRTVPHLAACMLARVDGKSPVDYLTRAAQNFVREIARGWLLSPPLQISAVLNDLRTKLNATRAC